MYTCIINVLTTVALFGMFPNRDQTYRSLHQGSDSFTQIHWHITLIVSLAYSYALFHCIPPLYDYSLCMYSSF